MKLNCSLCDFFFRHNETQTGQCKRFPPVIIIEQRRDSYETLYQEATTQQPWVQATDWCGEFKEP